MADTQIAEPKFRGDDGQEIGMIRDGILIVAAISELDEV
jgi:hypothetical protein